MVSQITKRHFIRMHSKNRHYVFGKVLLLRNVMGASVINHGASIHHVWAEDVLRHTQSILHARYAFFLDFLFPVTRQVKCGYRKTKGIIFPRNYFSSSSCFWDETFFQRFLENFLWTSRTCSGYLKGPPRDNCKSDSSDSLCGKILDFFSQPSSKLSHSSLL